MKAILFLLIFVITTTLIFSQRLIYPSLPSDEITGVHYLNDNEIIFVNDGGSIFKSFDGGLTWNLKKHFQGESLLSIKFVDSLNGFILPEKQPNTATIGLITTTDAGETWNLQPLSVTGIYDFLPLSNSISIKSTWDGKIQRLDNFYNNWSTVYELPKYTIIDPEFGEVEYSYGYISSIKKLSENELVALGVNKYAFSYNIIQDSLSFLLKSVDSGVTWDTLWIGLNSFAKFIDFATNRVGWLSNGKTIYKTIDGGQTWNEIDIGISYNSIIDLSAVDENILYVTLGVDLGKYQLIKSVDSGQNWEIRDINAKQSNKINFRDKNNGILYGSSLAITDNGGADWNIVHDPIMDKVISVDFVNKDTGIASGENGIYKTTDGGKSWKLKLSSGGSVKLLNNGTGWCVSYNIIHKTTDLGENWSEIKLSDKPQLYGGINYFDENLGIIYSVTEESKAGSRIYDRLFNYITKDGGISWEPIAADTNSRYGVFDKVKFTDSEHLFAISRTGLWLSKDTAKTWESIYDVDYFLGNISFDFYDSLFGVLTVSYYESYVTVDGGKNWKLFSKPVGNSPTDCKILGPDIWNEQRVLESGDNGKLLSYYFNSDGEITFSREVETFTKKNLNTIDVFVEDDFPYVWIGGGGFTFLFRQYEKIFTDVKTENNDIPSEFSLSQNYPNPFNPGTTISYSLPKSGFVQLIVYDMLGRKITDLVNKKQSAGNYEIVFDASELSSGIYFYRIAIVTESSGHSDGIKSVAFSTVKKLVLLK